jgi:hypothetical protein
VVNAAAAATTAAAARAAPGAARHAAELHAPWFAAAGDGTTLHRYLDDAFVPRFLQDARAGRLAGTRAQPWFAADRFGRADHPSLRLPMHRAFHVVCCEVSCAAPGSPAYDPRRVRSAGLVVRRGLPGAQVERWTLRAGEPLGWTRGAIPPGEPDEHRRLVARGLVPPRQVEPPYAGEETYPMHALLVARGEPGAPARSRTLLWGYLPLGGSHRAAAAAAAAPPSPELDAALGAELSWPFGTHEARAWRPEDARPVLDGLATPAFGELVATLLRELAAAAADGDGGPLRALLASVRFHPPPAELADVPYDRHAAPDPGTAGESLLSWLESSGDALQEWSSRLAAGRQAVAALPLPRQVGLDADGAPLTEDVTGDLYLTEAQAAALRALLVARGRAAAARAEEGLALPRFGQGDGDVFHVVPFVRWLDPCGCERVSWGPPSLPFRVASPLDPGAQRPQAVVLPRLADLRRGAPRGVALLAPRSLADVLRRLSPELPPGGSGPGNRAGLCWSFSFSLPVVTLCAMVLLMVLVNLLNLVFRWLPWAVLAVPRLCGKLLEEEP